MVHRVASVAVVSLLVAAAHAQQTRRADLIARVGDQAPGRPSGDTIASLNTPFTANNGNVGFTGSLTNDSTISFVWFDSAIIFASDQVPTPYALSGAEDTSGFGDQAQFFFSPSISIDNDSPRDGIWSNSGFVARGNDPAPGAPGLFFRAMSRPTLSNNSTGYFVATTSTSPGGATSGRAFYRWSFAQGLQPIFRTGQTPFPAPDNFPILFATPSISFVYDVSRDGSHVVNFLGLDTGSTFSDGRLVKDGAILFRDGDPVPNTDFGDNWSSWTSVSVNNHGDVVHVGTTTATTVGRFVYWNDRPVARQFDTVAGIPLDGVAIPFAASINNSGAIVHLWSHGSPSQTTLFYFSPSSPNTLDGSTCVLASTGDPLDLDGDSIPDATLTAFNINAGGTSPGLDLADDGAVYLNVSITGPDQIARDAIIRLAASCPAPCDPDANQDGNADQGDIDYLINVIAGGDNPTNLDPDFNRDGNADQGDIDALVNVIAGGSCP